MKPPPVPQTSVQRRIANDIDRFGWSGIGVFPTVDDPPETPRFTYTVGLVRSHGAPELIATGLPARNAHSILQTIIEKYVEAGKRLEPGARLDDVVKGEFVVELREVSRDARSEWLNAAKWWNGDGPWPTLQVVWPDEANRLPWDEGYDLDESVQPLLAVT